jgi:tRNA(Arg) A34 adenosine deaminase TadA
MARQNPAWMDKHWTETERMTFAVDLSQWNVEHGSGGPFGAAIFDQQNGKLVSVGVNRVEPGFDPTAHAEVIAIRMACQHLTDHNLARVVSDKCDGSTAALALYSSAEPCCLCVGAVLWSGLKTVFYAANRDAVEATGFDEGPQTSEESLAQRGVCLIHMPGAAGELSKSAIAVLEHYRRSGGLIYNGG